MSPRKIKRKQPDLRKNIEWLMFFRVLLISVLLGASVVFRYTERGSYMGHELLYLYFLIGITYFLTAVYIVLIRKIKNLKAFAFIQIAGDVLIVTGLVFLTGGIDSIFAFLYIPSIIGASIILYRPGGFVIASLSGILYGVMIDLEFYGIIRPYTYIERTSYNESYVFYNIFINIAAFYLIAFLAGYLAEQLRRTGQELIEKEIDYEELKLLNNDIVQNIQTGLITINNRGRVISFNRQAEDITEKTLEEVYLKPVESIIPGILSEMSAGEVIGNPDDLNRWTKEFISSKSQKKFVLGFSFSPLTNTKEQVIGKIILFQDITRIKEMEEEIKRSDRLATLGTLAANLAHEIRNPLASMSGSIQLLKSELSLDGQNKNLMEIVLQEIVRLNHLITDFLLYAKPTELKKERIDIRDVINETIAVFKNTPKGANKIAIETSFFGDTVINGDFMQLKQVFWNILINSSESMNNGGVIRVTTDGGVASHESGLVVRIKDSGRGIDEAMIPKVFEPFFSTRDGGTGLGLATVKKIVEIHDGTIDILSELNKGTEMIITFPRGL
jgi:two-component system sensor histidine kinase PilS (NtrC family)